MTLRIFTGRYSNPGVAACRLVPVGITRYPPRFRLAYELKANLYDLAPTTEMLQIAKEEHGRDRFTTAYLARLDRIGAVEILRQLRGMQGDRIGVVLLCYEDLTIRENWCHRLLVGQWLLGHAGLMVPELPDLGKAVRRKPPRDRRG